MNITLGWLISSCSCSDVYVVEMGRWMGGVEVKERCGGKKWHNRAEKGKGCDVKERRYLQLNSTKACCRSKNADSCICSTLIRISLPKLGTARQLNTTSDQAQSPPNHLARKQRILPITAITKLIIKAPTIIIRIILIVIIILIIVAIITQIHAAVIRRGDEADDRGYEREGDEPEDYEEDLET